MLIEAIVVRTLVDAALIVDLSELIEMLNRAIEEFSYNMKKYKESKLKCTMKSVKGRESV